MNFIYTYFIKTATVLLLLLSLPGLAHADKPWLVFKYGVGDRHCPIGYEMASYKQARNSGGTACRALGPWYIARLLRGGSQDGPGYSCRNRPTDKRALGHTLCKKIAAPTRECRAQALSATVIDSYCRIDRTKWLAKDIDKKRKGNVSGKPCGGSRESCWILDDRDRDHLNMRSNELSFRTRFTNKSHALPTNGSSRFIYVYRPNYNDILLRAYDRGRSYSAYQNTNNCSTGNSPCSGNYMHVRHSQLNGGWNPVWCAGEMRIEQGEVCLINNESGHFRPPASCTTHVLNTLKKWGVNVSAKAGVGNFQTYSAAYSCLSQDEL